MKCNQPTILNGSVTPADATVEQGETYEASCDSGFTISGWTTMSCQPNGTFDQTPSCEGKYYTATLLPYWWAFFLAATIKNLHRILGTAFSKSIN